MGVFEPMTSILGQSKQGEAEVRHYDVSKLESMMSSLRPGEYCPEGRYAQLLVRGQLVMSDTRMEHITNYEVVRQARGNMLIGGLGLGMILVPILRKKEVDLVTVVEVSADVASLVQPQIVKAVGPKLAKKLRVDVADIHEWRPVNPGRQFDVIYFDIWPDVCTDDLADMTKLRRRFARYLTVGGWAHCWKQDYLRHRRRTGW